MHFCNGNGITRPRSQGKWRNASVCRHPVGKDNGFARNQPQFSAISCSPASTLVNFDIAPAAQATMLGACTLLSKTSAALFPHPLPALPPGAHAPTADDNQEHRRRRSLCPITVASRNLLTQLSFSCAAQSRRRRSSINFFFSSSGWRCDARPIPDCRYYSDQQRFLKKSSRNTEPTNLP